MTIVHMCAYISRQALVEDLVTRNSKETIHFSTDFVWWIQATVAGSRQFQALVKGCIRRYKKLDVR